MEIWKTETFIVSDETNEDSQPVRITQLTNTATGKKMFQAVVQGQAIIGGQPIVQPLGIEIQAETVEEAYAKVPEEASKALLEWKEDLQEMILAQKNKIVVPTGMPPAGMPPDPRKQAQIINLKDFKKT